MTNDEIMYHVMYDAMHQRKLSVWCSASGEAKTTTTKLKTKNEIIDPYYRVSIYIFDAFR